MADLRLSDPSTFAALEVLFARFGEGLAAVEDVKPVVREMVQVIGQAADPERWRDALAEEFRGFLAELWPESEGEELSPRLDRCVDGICEFALGAPCPELAWLLLVRLDPQTTGPDHVVAEMTALLSLRDGIDTETVVEALIARADAEHDLGQEQAGIEDLIQAHSLAEDPRVRIGCAVDLVVVLSEGDELTDAAEWAWRAGLLMEEFEPEEDPETFLEIFAAQVTTMLQLERSDGPIGQIRALIQRMLSRPQWWPQEVNGAELAVLAAGAAIQDNDVAVALDHLGKARLRWDEADESCRAEWHLARGEAGVLVGDVNVVEQLVRNGEIRDWIRCAGTDEQRERLQVLARWSAAAAGTPEHGTADDPVKVLNDIVLRVGAGVVESSDLELIDRGIEQCDQVGQAHLIVVMYALKAMFLAALNRPQQALEDLARGHEQLRRLEENKPGGYPQQLTTLLDMAQTLVECASGRFTEGARIMDVTWRSSRAAGVLAMTTVTAAAAAMILLRSLHRPRAAAEAAVASLTAAQEIRHARADSADRFTASTLYAQAHELAIEAVEELADPQLMAEVLEVLRAQAMPRVSADPALTGGPLKALVGSLLSAVETAPEAERPKQTSPGVQLSPPPLILMPWGSIALAAWLSYPVDVERRSGRLVLRTAY